MKLRNALSLLLLFVSLTITANTNLTIAWDTSLSMQDRDLQKEFNFLQNYFSKYTETTVTVLEFNNVRVLESKFTVSGGDWSAIKNQLSTSLYDGATSYDNLAAKLSAGSVFVFTDGKETLIRDAVTIPGKPYIINSSASCDLENLQFLALSNKGRLVNLQQQGAAPVRGSREIGYVGNVYSPLVELEDITITIKDTDKKVTPRKDGTYRIGGNPGDILVVSAFGKTLTEKTLDRNRTLNLWVEDDIEQLDEVFLKKKRAPVEGEEETELGGRKASKRSIGYSTSSVGEKQIDEYPTLADAVRGKFAGVTVGDDLSNVKISRLTSNLGGGAALVVLDGAPLPAGVTVAGMIQPQDVASIDILKGFAATNIYGSEGRNGVVLITSKMEVARRGGKEYKKEDPKNLYKGPALTESEFVKPNYLLAFDKEKTVPALYTAYMGQRETNWDSPLYLSDVYEYFSNWDNEMAEQIAYNAVERDSELTILRSMLFTAYKLGNTELALDLAYAALDKYPQQTQSYLDLAMAQKANGNYQDALNRLLAIENGSANPVLDFTNLQSIADNEIRNLVQDHKPNLELSKIQVRHLKKKDLNARIVIDWSNHDVEFELTFINPDNLYTQWKHTLANEELIEQEVLHGFSQKEFEIDGGTKGEWTINVKYIGNKDMDDMNPTLLKCTIHHNIGTSNERTEQKIIRLSKQGSEQLLVKLNTK